MTAGETVSFKASNTAGTNARWATCPRISPECSLVLVRPASRPLQANGRPVFIVGIKSSVELAQVEAVQHAAGSDFEMKIVTYRQLDVPLAPHPQEDT